MSEQRAEGTATAPTGAVTGTARVLSAGTLLSAACFVIGFVLSLIGRDTTAGDPLRPDLIAASVVQLQPWGWSMLGVLVLLATPPIGLAVTYLEMRRRERQAAPLALVVLAVLGVATAIALALR